MPVRLSPCHRGPNACRSGVRDCALRSSVERARVERNAVLGPVPASLLECRNEHNRIAADTSSRGDDMGMTNRSWGAIAALVLMVSLPGCAAKIQGSVQLVDAGLQPVANESAQGTVVNMINTTAAVEQASHAVTVDAQGKFESAKDRLRPGTYKVEASRIGYETETQTVEIGKHTSKKIDFKLKKIQEARRKTIQGSRSDEDKIINPGEVNIQPPTMSGHHIKPWKTTFLIKLGKDGKVIDRYSFEADLAVTRYFTVAVNEGGTPVTDATVKLHDKELGKTDAKGELVHEYTTLPPKGVTLTVSKSGYAAWQNSASVQAGERLQVALARRAVLTVTASSDEYGVRAGVPGVAVSIDGRPLGKTDDRGNYTYTYDGAPGRKAQVALSAPGYLPTDWKTAVALEGQVSVQRAFAPATPRPIRVGVHRFVGNTPGVDLKDVASQAETAVAAQLFKASVFREVPATDLEREVKRLKVGIDRIATRGWQDTPLRRTVDMIVFG